MSQLSIPFGRYELLERVAMGGMAEVFKARHVGREGFQKDVCIKRILPQFCTEEGFIQMFIDEAKLAAKLQHANIVQIFDFDQVDGSYYIAMEFIQGKDLRTVIKQGEQSGMPLGPILSAFICAEMCKGLHYAHQRDGLGLVHRDISPHNVLVSMLGEVKVMDFGIAKAADRITHTSTGIIKGKLAYMAPEQAAGGEIDHRVDQFATALVLSEMLTGRRAYEGAEPVVLRKALAADVQPPSMVVPTVPPELDEIFLKATAMDPGARYPDMRAFERALMQFIYKRAPSEEEQDLGLHMRRLFDKDPYASPTESMFDGEPPSRLVATAPSRPSSVSAPSVVSSSNSQLAAAVSEVFTSAGASAPTRQSDPKQLLSGSLPLAGTPEQATRTHMAASASQPVAPTAQRSAPAVLSPAVVPVTTEKPAAPPSRGVPVPVVAGGVAVVALGIIGFVVMGRSPTTAPSPAPVAAPAPPVQAAPAPVAQPAPVEAAKPVEATKPVETAKPAEPVKPVEEKREEKTASDDAEDKGARGKRALGTVQAISEKGWAEVFVRGSRKGETPVAVQLPAGKNTITFRNPETGQEKSVVVNVKGNETVKVMSPLK
ncbi:MAG: serine/threonine-protein kinase [Myxococcota bacterium]